MGKQQLKYTNMNTQFLMALLRQQNPNKDEIVEILQKRLQNIKLSDLLKRWKIEKNTTLKDILEIAIAYRIVQYNYLFRQTRLSNFVKNYLTKINSLDAICILMRSENSEVKDYADYKYHQLLDAYLESLEDLNILYATEGDDTSLVKKDFKILKFTKRNEGKNEN